MEGYAGGADTNMNIGQVFSSMGLGASAGAAVGGEAAGGGSGGGQQDGQQGGQGQQGP